MHKISLFILFSICSSMYAADRPVNVALKQMEIKGTKLAWGVSMIQGKRKRMEDRFAVATQSGQSFFGVYDGHRGDQAACYLVKQLHKAVFESDEATAYKKVDEKLNQKSGTTAVTARVTSVDDKRELRIAWAGDSKAILVKQDEKVSFSTKDHKPSNQKERDRIYAAQGYVLGKKVNGLIAVSRALGDNIPDLKGHTGKRLVIPDPEIYQKELTDDDVCLILASDGLWDVISPKRAALIALTQLRAKREKAPEKKHSVSYTQDGNDDQCICAAKELKDAAYNAGSSDNITVLVVLLNELKQVKVKPSSGYVQQELPDWRDILSADIAGSAPWSLF